MIIEFNLDGILIASLFYSYLHAAEYLIKAGADIHAQDNYALRFASYHGNLDVVKYLIRAGADIHAWNDSALSLAASQDHPAVVDCLIEAGCSFPNSKNILQI